MNIEADRSDWHSFKAEIGLTDALEQSAPNHVEIPAEEWRGNFYMAPSRIAGNGTFAALAFCGGSLVGPAWIKGKRTELGCYGNHSTTPTAKMMFRDGNVWLETIASVDRGAELTTNYRDTLSTMRDRGVIGYE
jgi:hypothetical protein